MILTYDPDKPRLWFGGGPMSHPAWGKPLHPEALPDLYAALEAHVNGTPIDDDLAARLLDLIQTSQHPDAGKSHWHCPTMDAHEPHGYTGDRHFGYKGYRCDGTKRLTDAEKLAAIETAMKS